MFCSLHPEPSCYLMGCDCDVYMHGECGHFQLGHSKGAKKVSFPPGGVVSVLGVEACSGSSSKVFPSHTRGPGSIPTTIRDGLAFGIHICSDILV